VGSCASARTRLGAAWAPVPWHASDGGTWISRAEVVKRLDLAGRGAPVNLHATIDLGPWIHAPLPLGPMAPTRAIPGTRVAPSASYSCDASRRRPPPRAPWISRPRVGSASTCAAATTCCRRTGSSSRDSGRLGQPSSASSFRCGRLHLLCRLPFGITAITVFSAGSVVTRF
jgi:hypothetical protein